MDDDITTIIHTSAEAALDISGMKVAEEGEVDLIRANSLPRSTYATLALTTLPSTADTFREAAALTKADIGEFERQLKNEILPKTMSAIGQSLLDFYGCYLDKIDGKPAIITEYRRTGQNGPVLVQISRIFSETQEVSLNLSYRESEGIIWKPVLSKMRHSISIN